MRRRAVGAAATAAFALTLTGTASSAAPADLDAAFGNHGIATVDSGGQDTSHDLAIQPDGKIVGVGSTLKGSESDALVYRLDRDGRPDPAFAVRTLGQTGQQEAAYAVTLQPDGRIVVVGETSLNNDVAVWRLLPDGRPDSSFGGDGMATLDSGGTEVGLAVAVDSAGAVVVTGRSSVGVNGSLTIYRLTAAGLPDSTFDGDGAYGFDTAGYDAGYAVTVLPDRRIVLAGEIGAASTPRIYRLMPNGLPDNSFDGDGVAELPKPWSNRVRDLHLLDDGSFYVLGESFGTSYDAAVARMTAAGAVDPGFGGPTGAHLDAGADETLYSLDVAADGKVVAAGHTTAGTDPLVARFRADGQPDETFGTGGTMRPDGGSDYVSGAAVQPDGKILVTGDNGRTNLDAVVYRLLGDARTAVPRCHGKPATIVGTPGKDRIKGTNKPDVIVALGDNDVVRGRGGKDVICGGAGKDELYGGAGRDTILGGPGKDVVVQGG